MPSSPSPERKRKSEDPYDTERRNKRRRKENRETHRRAQQEHGSNQAPSGTVLPSHRQESQQRQAAQDGGTPATDGPHVQRKISKAEKRERKLEKKRQKESGEAIGAPAAEASDQAVDTSQTSGQGALIKAGRKKRRKHRKSKVEKSKKRQVAAGPNALDLVPSAPLWNLSEPVGSHFIDVPPKPSQDEEYLICATESSITEFSTSDATPIHALRRDAANDVFTTFDLSSQFSDNVWAATRKGRLTRWLPKSGQVSVKRRLQANVQSIHTVRTDDGEENLIVLRSDDTRWIIAQYDPVQDQEYVLLKDAAPIRDLQICDDGRIIVAITMSGLLVGAAASGGRVVHQRPGKVPEYIWGEVTCSEPPMCMDVKTRGRKKATQEKHNRQDADNQLAVDVVVGGLRGSIFVFHDILDRLGIKQEGGFTTKPRQQSREQQLHWHREAVGSVAWSLDGQYIVSGGRETVLVLWQLETGRKQFLPNLESPIEHISVSPSGASYLIRLADNSVMILSAAELAPTAHIAGIQSTSFSRSIRPTPHLPTVDLLSQFGAEQSSNVAAAAVNPRSTEHLLVSVPAHQAGFSVGGPFSPAPYLQDFDVFAGRFVYRQALARTNAINVNLGPEGNSILEPNVKHLQVSHDGRWLATVDEWEMPLQDRKDFTLETDAAGSAVRESKMRFWLWNEAEKCWSLNSRVDEPHRFEEQPGCHSCLALAVDPSSLKFATLGADSTVKIWAPKSKLKNGKIVRGEVSPDAKGNSRVIETWWAIESTINLEQSVAFDSFQAIKPDRAVLTYSSDGSILAAYQHYDSYNPLEPVLHFLDATTGSLYDSRTGLAPDSDDILDIDFYQQQLLILSRDSVSIWDITTFDLIASIPFPEPKDGKHTPIPEAIPHFAVNTPSKTFAVALPEYSSFNRGVAQHPLMQYRTHLAVYSFEDVSKEAEPKPVFTAQLPRITMALLSASGVVSTGEDKSRDANEARGLTKGYVVLDLGAEVRRIMMTGVTTRLAGKAATAPRALGSPLAADNEPGAMELDITTPLEQNESSSGDEDDIASDARPSETGDAIDFSHLINKDEDNRPVVRREQLAEVFDYPTLAMPPMIDLFNGVMKLYRAKPKTADEDQDSEVEAEDEDMEGAQDRGVPQLDGAADEAVRARRDVTGKEIESEDESSSSSDDEEDN